MKIEASKKYIFPSKPSYVNTLRGIFYFDQAYKVLAISSDSMSAYVCPVVRKKNYSTNEDVLEEFEDLAFEIVWKYRSWRTLDGLRILTRKKEFDDKPYL